MGVMVIIWGNTSRVSMWGNIISLDCMNITWKLGEENEQKCHHVIVMVQEDVRASF